MSEMRPEGMRRIRWRATPMDDWQVMPIGTEVQFETELGDVRVRWAGGTGRVKVMALGADDVLDAVDVHPLSSNAVSVGLTGERLGR